jgi:hypothetical protein
VRLILVSLVLAVSAIATAETVRSDPAFLGIGMTQMSTRGGCVITEVTANSPAAEAGIQRGDEIEIVDGTALHPGRACDELNGAIVAHQPDDAVELTLLRNGEPRVVHPVLATRSQVLERRVGQRLGVGAVVEDPDGHHWELGERRGHALVIGAFDEQCVGCVGLVDHVAERLARRAPSAEALAVTTDGRTDLEVRATSVRAIRGVVPMALADAETFDSLTTAENNRVFFTVIDCRGIVRLIAPIAPDADDIDAAIDEVLGGAEQAEHARIRR